MRKYILIAGVMIVSIAVLFACSNASEKKAEVAESAYSTAEVYTCKMHPEVFSNKPGKCPKCGMELVKKSAASADSTKH